MTTPDDSSHRPDARHAGRRALPVSVSMMSLSGLASLGAGAIHAGAVGIHAEDATLARLFVAVAAAQLGCGVLALVRGGRVAAALTALVNAGAVVAWGATRLWDISWVSGLERHEAPGFADAACAALGAVAAVVAVVALARGRTEVTRARLGLPAVAIGCVVVAAMVVGAGHVHSDDAAAADGHDHGHAADGAVADPTPVGVGAAVGATTSRPYDPSGPVDLSGTPGVTPQQQAFAENLVAVTLVELPQWADPAVAEAAGFRSIGDGATGHEHFINWDWINDDVFLDPDHPESLVYEPQPDGTRKLVSAMYMLPESETLADVPEWGGALMQWHIHNNLCFDTSGDAPRVGGLTDSEGRCTAPLVKMAEAPMIHVWITANGCGPFAALEGLGAGQVAEGEEHLCDHLHGSTSDGG